MEIEIDLSQVNASFGNLEHALEDATPLFNLIGQELELSIDDNFRSETDPDGNPWAALSPKYEAYKQRKGFIAKINQRRGNLRGTINYRAYRDKLEVGANVPYSKEVQKRRPFLYSRTGSLGTRAERRIERVVDNYIQNLIDGSSS
jgi:phage virion morphogenesis protein